MSDTGKIRVLIVDDSAVMRQLLTAIFREDPAFEVVATAADPLIARQKIKDLQPDVLTLDVEMPRMDGITFLERLMRLRPMPVVMISSLTQRNTEATMQALELGAVDFVTKPANGMRDHLGELADEIRSKVRMAAMARVRVAMAGPVLTPPATPPVVDRNAASEGVIAIGASAGGTQAIMEILRRLPGHVPGIAIVQHMPPKFTALFADHLNRCCALDVREATDGEKLCSGMARVAPGGRQMLIKREKGEYILRVYDGPQVNLHRPSVDVLFHSVAQMTSARTMGALLTGMGSDGAQGLKAMHAAGAFTLAQDEASSVIFGMPDQAIRLGAVREVLPLERIAARIQQWSACAHDTQAPLRKA